MGYFAQYNGLSHIASLQSQGNHKLEFGYGSYGYEPNVDSFFGIARGIKTGGAALNILFANTVERKDGDKDARVQLRFQTGLISSALEHAVPEQMFSDPENPTDGVSAVKALQLAAQEGQRIYQIDSSNVNTILSQISLDASVEDEIRTYVRGNRIAITHSNNISVPGWSGAGYILLDLETGAGSYKISGGRNGGFLGDVFTDADKELFKILGFVALAATGTVVLSFAITIFLLNFITIIKTALVLYSLFSVVQTWNDLDENCSETFTKLALFIPLAFMQLFLRASESVPFGQDLLLTIFEAILGKAITPDEIEYNC